jgi:hypothetical protein
VVLCLAAEEVPVRLGRFRHCGPPWCYVRVPLAR